MTENELCYHPVYHGWMSVTTFGEQHRFTALDPKEIFQICVSGPDTKDVQLKENLEQRQWVSIKIWLWKHFR